jgi:hypothetical protein
LIEETTMIESYYTPEQLADLKKRGEAMGEEAIRRSQQDWAEWMAEVRAAMDSGTDPLAPEVLDLARRWKALIDAFTGGDPGIRQSLGRLWKERGDDLVAQFNMANDPRVLMEYIGPALAAVGETVERHGADHAS